MRIAPWICGLAACGALAAAGDVQACAKRAAPEIAMRITQPLLASVEANNSLQIEVAADGCVRVHYPKYDTRAGDYVYTLSARELNALRAEIAATRIGEFRPDMVRADLARRQIAKRAQPDAISYRVTDEEVIEISLGAAAAKVGSAPMLAWSGLREQLLNHPDQPDLIALSAARDRLSELAADPRAKKVQP
jgi:hypothetical protein